MGWSLGARCALVCAPRGLLLLFVNAGDRGLGRAMEMDGGRIAVVDLWSVVEYVSLGDLSWLGIYYRVEVKMVWESVVLVRYDVQSLWNVRSLQFHSPSRIK